MSTGRIIRCDPGERPSYQDLGIHGTEDDRLAFGEAMADADVSVRVFQRELCKLEALITALYKAKKEGRRDSIYGAALHHVRRISAMIDSPALNQWRQKHSQGRGKRHSQQHILEVRLARARVLLAERGIDLDKEHVS